MTLKINRVYNKKNFNSEVFYLICGTSAELVTLAVGHTAQDVVDEETVRGRTEGGTAGPKNTALSLQTTAQSIAL